MTAPTCPVSTGQLPYYRSLFRGSSGGQPNAPMMPSIPSAHDLPSLIITVNATLDVLRQLTSTRTVNNFYPSKSTTNIYLPKQPNFKSQGNTYYAQYPQWAEVKIEGSSGYVTGKKDKNSRAYVGRQNRVIFENQVQEDPEFKWSYSIPIK